MSTCKLCKKRSTRWLCLDVAARICGNCKVSMKEGNYEVMINDNDDDGSNVNGVSKHDISIPHNKCKDDTTIEENDIQGETCTFTMEPILNMNNYKDALLASLYSQVDFL